MIYLKLLLLSIVIVFVIDLSGFITHIEKLLAKWLKTKTVIIPKPFSCSLCTTWWIGLIYLICLGELNIFTLTYTALLAFYTDVIYNILLKTKEIINPK